jgi:hypothetical protein
MATSTPQLSVTKLIIILAVGILILAAIVFPRSKDIDQTAAPVQAKTTVITIEESLPE